MQERIILRWNDGMYALRQFFFMTAQFTSVSRKLFAADDAVVHSFLFRFGNSNKGALVFYAEPTNLVLPDDGPFVRQLNITADLLEGVPAGDLQIFSVIGNSTKVPFPGGGVVTLNATLDVTWVAYSYSSLNGSSTGSDTDGASPLPATLALVVLALFCVCVLRGCIH